METTQQMGFSFSCNSWNHHNPAGLSSLALPWVQKKNGYLGSQIHHLALQNLQAPVISSAAWLQPLCSHAAQCLG